MAGAGAGGNLSWLDYILVVVQFGSVRFAWVGLVRFIGSLSLRLAWPENKKLVFSSLRCLRRRFVLCDHHYLRFAASFYGARVAAGASAALPSPPPTTICLKPQPFFNIQRWDGPKNREIHIYRPTHTQTRDDDVCLKVVVKFHYWVSFVGVSRGVWVWVCVVACCYFCCCCCCYFKRRPASVNISTMGFWVGFRVHTYLYTAKLYTNGYIIPSHTCIGSIPSRGAIFLLDRRKKRTTFEMNSTMGSLFWWIDSKWVKKSLYHSALITCIKSTWLVQLVVQFRVAKPINHLIHLFVFMNKQIVIFL